VHSRKDGFEFGRAHSTCGRLDRSPGNIQLPECALPLRNTSHIPQHAFRLELRAHAVSSSLIDAPRCALCFLFDFRATNLPNRIRRRCVCDAATVIGSQERRPPKILLSLNASIVDNFSAMDSLMVGNQATIFTLCSIPRAASQEVLDSLHWSACHERIR
jgi:hypothetical protein